MQASVNSALGRKGFNIRTVTGHYVDLANPSVEQVDLIDMAHALGNINRFLGHTQSKITVLEHVLNTNRRAEARALITGEPNWETVAYAALMHDAHECYVCDIPTPLKHLVGKAYMEIEDAWQKAVFDWAGIPISYAEHWIVKEADREMLLTEARDYHGATDEELRLYWPEGSLLPRLPRLSIDEARASFIRLVNGYRARMKA